MTNEVRESGSAFHDDFLAVKVEQAVLQAAHGLAVDEDLDLADGVAVFGGGLSAIQPFELAPGLTGEFALTAAHVVEVKDLAGVREVLFAMLFLQIVREGLRIDQTGAQTMEDEGHEAYFLRAGLREALAADFFAGAGVCPISGTVWISKGRLVALSNSAAASKPMRAISSAVSQRS